MAGRLESTDPRVLRVPHLVLVNNRVRAGTQAEGCHSKSLGPPLDELISGVVSGEVCFPSLQECKQRASPAEAEVVGEM